jgi:hypothetical protein
MCGNDIVAEGGFNTVYSGGYLYACHSSRRDCDGGASYDTLEKVERLDEMSADEKLRSRVMDPAGRWRMKRGSTPVKSSLPDEEELAARRLGELVERFPMHALQLGKERADLMWDTDYIDNHPSERFLRERFEIREIGRQLDRKGGMELMRRVAHRATEVGPGGGPPVTWVLSHVQHLWDGIGQWRR